MLRTRFCTFGADLYAQSVLGNKISASEFSRKSIEGALLVGKSCCGRNLPFTVALDVHLARKLNAKITTFLGGGGKSKKKWKFHEGFLLSLLGFWQHYLFRDFLTNFSAF